MKWNGVYPVVQTPWKNDGSLDASILKKEVDWLFQEGCAGLVVGMVSEVQRMTEGERDAFNEQLIVAASGRGPVVASVGAESSLQACRHARAAKRAGAAALMAIPPALTRCESMEIIGYYETLLGVTDLPIIVQDASGYMGNPIPLETQAHIYSLDPRRVMFKPEAQPIGLNLSGLRKLVGKEAVIFEGTGGVALVESYHRGIQATMPGADLPWALVRLWRALEAGDDATIARIHPLICAILTYATNLDAFLAIEKLFLVEQGIFANEIIRGPVGYRMDEQARREVRSLLILLKQACLEG